MANKIRSGIDTLGTSGTVTIDLVDGADRYQYEKGFIGMTGAVTIAFANAASGDAVAVGVENTSGGPLDFTFPAGVKLLGNVTALTTSIPNNSFWEMTATLYGSQWLVSLEESKDPT